MSLPAFSILARCDLSACSSILRALRLGKTLEQLCGLSHRTTSTKIDDRLLTTCRTFSQPVQVPTDSFKASGKTVAEEDSGCRVAPDLVTEGR